MNRELFHGGWLDSSDRGCVVNGNISVTRCIKDNIIGAGRASLSAGNRRNRRRRARRAQRRMQEENDAAVCRIMLTQPS
jgi:hypothetical protein